MCGYGSSGIDIFFLPERHTLFAGCGTVFMVHAPSQPAIVVPLNYDTKKEERREILIYAVSLL